MMLFSQRKLFASFIITMSFLLVITVISYQSTQRFISTARQVGHTQETVKMLDLQQMDLLKAEYANRNYVVTGDENIVNHYQTSIYSVTAELKNLGQLTADNRNQQQNLGGLKSIIAEKLIVMGKISNFRRGNNVAEAESIRPRGTFLREDISRRLEEIKDEERMLLSEQRANSQSIEQRNMLLSLVSFAVSFALLVVFYLLNHDTNKRKRVEQKREKLIKKSETASGEVPTLQGLLVICSYCKSIRDDQNFWQGVENYISKHTEAQFSHGICPNCYEKIVKPELEEMKRRRQAGR
ncbi:MAG: CHASE3 domain-containing protein [Acidobacteriota bacterium]|nr:CHASE3 domain-containing protein [Acidobacteriota bacterium]